MRLHRTGYWLTAVLGWLSVGGCAPMLSDPPTKDDVNALLTRFILRPEMTCADLARLHNLSYLTIPVTPSDAGLSYYETWVEAEPGVLLRVWYLPARLNRGVVIVAPGAGGSIPCYLFAPRLLVQQGWSVVMFDYRGFGLSTGHAAIETLDIDLERVLDWTLTAIGPQQVTLMGISLGTIPAVAVAARRPEAVEGLILDSPVALGPQIERFQSLLPIRARSILAQLDPDLRSDTRIREIAAPLLVFIHGNDTLTPPETEEVLFANAPEPKEAVRFSGLPHAGGAYFETSAYISSISRFLDESLLP